MKLEKTHMKTLADLREQIQEDILTYLEAMEGNVNFKMGFRYKAELCQVVVKRFNEYNKKDN
jgi:hypothetical protein